MRPLSLVLLSLFCLLPIGCGDQTASPPFFVDADGMTVTVDQYSGSSEWTGSVTGGDANYRDKASGRSFSIRSRQLRVNAADFGTLEPGDKVLIEGGRVTVNGAPRLAIPPK